MRIKASVDYGIRAIMYIAFKGGVCSSKEISEEMAIPRDYLIQLALRLRDAGVIIARPGKNGGYELAKAPEKITLRDVLEAFETEEKEPRHPLTKRKSNRDAVTASRYSHKVIANSIISFCKNITMRDIMEGCKEGASTKQLIGEALAKESERLLSK